MTSGTGAGVMLKAIAAERGGARGVLTVTGTTPGDAISPAVIGVVSVVLDTKLVGRGDPFHWITDVLVNDEPVAVRVNPAPSATTVVCDKDVRTGTGGMTLNDQATDLWIEPGVRHVHLRGTGRGEVGGGDLHGELIGRKHRARPDRSVPAHDCARQEEEAIHRDGERTASLWRACGRHRLGVAGRGQHSQEAHLRHASWRGRGGDIDGNVARGREVGCKDRRGEYRARGEGRGPHRTADPHHRAGNEPGAGDRAARREAR